MKLGVIRNPRSHGNIGKVFPAPGDEMLFAQPKSAEAVADVLKMFAGAGVELLVVDGGDGTVRDVLSALPAAFKTPPLLSVLPSGKTNILAFDLGIRETWNLEAVRAAALRGGRIRIRPPLEVRRGRGEPLVGFVFGVAALVQAVVMAQDLHKAKVVKNTAVGLTLFGALAQFSTGGEKGVWRQGKPVSLAIDDAPPRDGARLITMATTLHRLPFAMRPFGRSRPGMKVLDVDAPPRRLATALPKVLWGRGDTWLAKHGYRRGAAQRLRLVLDSPFILDGELYPGGDLTVSEGPPLRFLTP